MTVTVVGSVAYDTIETGNKVYERILGGSATFFSMACSKLSKCSVVGCVGDDFSHIPYLREREINVDGIEVIKGGKTFFWHGKYDDNLVDRDTISTELNVFAEFNPKLKDQPGNKDMVFLANILPALQDKVLDLSNDAWLTGLDTMNLWIDTARADLERVLSKVDVFFINESEAEMLCHGPRSVTRCGEEIMKMGPKVVVIKLGPFGARLFFEDKQFNVGVYPETLVKDTTGAGDAFAGGFMGFMQRASDLNFENLCRAMLYGSATASFAVEEFSVDGLDGISEDDIYRRAKAIWNLNTADLPGVAEFI